MSHNDALEVDQYCPLPNGSKLHYGIRGQGTPILLIMGFMARGRAWRSQIEAFAPHFSVVWFDHRGVGDSPGPAAKTMVEFAEDCCALMDHLNWDKAHVVGISMGGMIAQEFALKEPKRVLSLTLIVTHYGGWSKILPTRLGLARFFRAQFARTPQKRLEALKDLLVPKQVSEEANLEELFRKLTEDFTPKPPASTRFRHFRAILRHRTQKRLKHLSCPTLVVQAQEDLLIHPKHSEALAAEIPKARLLSFAQAGHGIVRQSNIELSDKLKEHFTQNSHA